MNRRQTLKLLSSGATALAFSPTTVFAEEAKGAMKKIPSSGEEIPVLGMGTWRTFNVGSDTVLRDRCAEVLKTFFANGGSMIDNSPMYGSAREVVGYALKKIGIPKNLFSAEKIFTEDGTATRTQTAESAGLWGVKSFDLMQIHNLVAWQEHLATLRKMKEEGVIRYLGITTSHGRRHEDLEKIMKSEPLDFVQLTYNITNREVEERLLPVAAEKGIAIIANRPFD
jgi:diketogulonate reductase-like aldo/keto reductase